MVPANDRATRNRRSVFMMRERILGWMELRIVRFTTAFDDACHFYGELLGWPITYEWPARNGNGRGRLFGYGDVARIEFVERTGGQGYDDPVSGVFLSVEHADVVELHDRLRAAGVSILRPINDTPWGHRAFAVHDPTGIELVHFQPIA